MPKSRWDKAKDIQESVYCSTITHLLMGHNNIERR